MLDPWITELIAASPTPGTLKVVLMPALLEIQNVFLPCFAGLIHWQGHLSQLSGYKLKIR